MPSAIIASPKLLFCLRKAKFLQGNLRKNFVSKKMCHLKHRISSTKDREKKSKAIVQD